MILDIGCGSEPRGNVNIDLLIPNADYRQEIKPKEIENFIKAHAYFLPFKDSAFDVVYCSHLLEHLGDPDRALKEMERVSNYRIILKVPFALFEFATWLVRPKKFFWRRQHHKRLYWARPFPGYGPSRLRFIGLKSAALKKVSHTEKLKFPIPFETVTIITLGERK